MILKHLWKTPCASIAILSVAPSPSCWVIEGVEGDGSQFVEIAPSSNPEVQAFAGFPGAEPPLSHDEKLALLRKKMKYVFVLFQENRFYALNAEGLTTANGKIVARSTGLPPTSNPTLAQKQKAELVMSRLDCDTVPFLWRYADRFTLFDHFTKRSLVLRRPMPSR